jgi:hypothetical protein
MRTTLDLPDDLLRQAKIAAVQRRSTLRDLVASGLRRELAAAADVREARPGLPVIRLPADAPVLHMTPAALKAALAEADAADDARFPG